MPFTEDRKRKVWIPLMVSLILVIGFTLGVITQRFLINTKPLEKFINREDPIDEIISLIDLEYVDNISKDSLYLDAVNGILSHLDPHTVYIPANQLVQANEILEGSGKGIGVDYFFLNDTLLITGLDNNGPAMKSGLKLGDKIIKVNSTIIAGKNVTEEQAIQAFKTASDTLGLTVVRRQDSKPLHINLIKDNVKHSSIAAAYLLDDQGTGYIKLSIFSASSYDDFIAAIEDLIGKGMKQLIFDLRGNGGGYLDQAISIADEFIDGEKLLVYTDGKNEGKYEYNAAIDGVYESGKLIILMDEQSASASEVLAGAVQDWDRGLIVGMTSFGKGLVQEQYELSDGSAIRITTSRYFTPSGRTIQKPYSRGLSATNIEDSTISKATANVYHTLKFNRAIYGNGGISPDVVSAFALEPSSPELYEMMNNEVFNKFINTYYFNNYKKDYLFENFQDFNKSFNVNDDVLKALKEFFMKENAILTQAIWNNPEDITYLKILTKAHIAKLEYSKQAFYEVLNTYDATVSKAQQIITSETYNSILKKSK